MATPITPVLSFDWSPLSGKSMPSWPYKLRGRSIQASPFVTGSLVVISPSTSCGEQIAPSMEIKSLSCYRNVL